MSETKSRSTASDQPDDGPPFISTRAWLAGTIPPPADERAAARVFVGGKLDGLDVLTIEVRDASAFAGNEFSGLSVTLPPEALANRKLRRLATFHRGQGRLSAEMDVQDELRAMEVLAKTLDSLTPPARHRALGWLSNRHHANEVLATIAPPYPSHIPADIGLPPQESLRIAKERVTS